MFLETHCATDVSPEISAARYYRGRSLHDDLTNVWSPNELCLRDMLSDCSFSVERAELVADRCFVACRISENSEGAYKLRLAYGLVPRGQ